MRFRRRKTYLEGLTEGHRRERESIAAAFEQRASECVTARRRRIWQEAARFAREAPR